MNKKLILFAAVAAMLTACSNTDELNVAQQEQQAQKGIAFDVYTMRAQTRAGLPGNNADGYGITTASLKSGVHAAAGFGVFGFYTDNSNYDTNASTPNFMYNEQVTWADNAWTYEPVKYWPNEYGDAAISDDFDHVTFFAYAPWIEVNVTNGVPTIDGVVNSLLPTEFDAEQVASLLLGEGVGINSEKADLSTNLNLWAFLNGYTKWETVTNEVNNESNPDFNSNDPVEAPNLPYLDYLTGEPTEASTTEVKEVVCTINTEAATNALRNEFKNLIQKYNITQLTRNTALGDPIVKYVVDTKPATSVDLLWGVAADDNGYKGMEKDETIDGGNCYIDLSKQTGVADSIKWNFKHALARLNIQICTNIDEATPVDVGSIEISTKGDGDRDYMSKVYLREINIGGFVKQAALNLHSEDVTGGVAAAEPNWIAYDGTNNLIPETAIFKDGLKNGSEGINNNIDRSELPSLLNPVLLEYPTDLFGSFEKKNDGIPNYLVNLFAGSKTESDPIYVIPTGEEMEISVLYDILTKDERLAATLTDKKTHGVEIENLIKKPVTDAGGNPIVLEAGKSYTIKLYLGLESVKFTAEVTPWPDEDEEGQVELPQNLASDDSGEGGGGTTPETPNYVTPGTYNIKFILSGSPTYADNVEFTTSTYTDDFGREFLQFERPGDTVIYGVLKDDAEFDKDATVYAVNPETNKFYAQSNFITVYSE